MTLSYPFTLFNSKIVHTLREKSMVTRRKTLNAPKLQSRITAYALNFLNV